MVFLLVYRPDKPDSWSIRRSRWTWHAESTSGESSSGNQPDHVRPEGRILFRIPEPSRRHQSTSWQASLQPFPVVKLSAVLKAFDHTLTGSSKVDDLLVGVRSIRSGAFLAPYAMPCAVRSCRNLDLGAAKVDFFRHGNCPWSLLANPGRRPYRVNDYHMQARRLIDQAQNDQVQGGSVSMGTRIGESILHAARTATAMHVALLGGNPATTSGQEGRKQ